MIRDICRAALALAVLPLSACAITPGPERLPAQMCNFRAYNLQVAIPKGQSDGDVAPPAVAASPMEAARQALDGTQPSPVAPTFQEVLREALAPAAMAMPPNSDPRVEPISPSMLFLSGGSQNGAFGAGFLHGWAAAQVNGLPRFRVVTGISTGAILSTFAFLDETGIPNEYYRIKHETDVLQPWVSAPPSQLGVTDLPTILRRGAVGELQPLREKLQGLMTPERLQAVATEYGSDQAVREGLQRRRHLYVAAVDIDTGQAVVFDQGEMARRAVTSGEFTRYRDCFVEAIIASSSVPLAAPPTFIDNRMYIDGGARFGLITDEIGSLLRERAPGVDEDRPAIYTIVNGTLELDERCGKVDESLCARPRPPSGGLYGQHRDWRLDELAFRSLSILINQGYRFSTEAIVARAERLRYPLYFARIDDDLTLFKHHVPRPLGPGELTCPEWRSLDIRADRPLEFHPRFMHCLTQYGVERGRAQRWTPVIPARAME